MESGQRTTAVAKKPSQKMAETTAERKNDTESPSKESERGAESKDGNNNNNNNNNDDDNADDEDGGGAEATTSRSSSPEALRKLQLLQIVASAKKDTTRGKPLKEAAKRAKAARAVESAAEEEQEQEAERRRKMQHKQRPAATPHDSLMEPRLFSITLAAPLPRAYSLEPPLPAFPPAIPDSSTITTILPLLQSSSSPPSLSSFSSSTSSSPAPPPGVATVAAANLAAAQSAHHWLMREAIDGDFGVSWRLLRDAAAMAKRREARAFLAARAAVVRSRAVAKAAAEARRFLAVELQDAARERQADRLADAFPHQLRAIRASVKRGDGHGRVEWRRAEAAAVAAARADRKKRQRVAEAEERAAVEAAETCAVLRSSRRKEVEHLADIRARRLQARVGEQKRKHDHLLQRQQANRQRQQASGDDVGAAALAAAAAAAAAEDEAEAAALAAAFEASAKRLNDEEAACVRRLADDLDVAIAGADAAALAARVAANKTWATTMGRSAAAEEAKALHEARGCVTTS